MKVSAPGRAALIAREGCRLTAYLDSVGVPTIGVGHTGRAGPPPVKLGMTLTRAEAEDIFADDLAPFEAAVNRAVTVAMTQGQFDALVSLAFNIGAHGFAGSTVVHKLNQGLVREAADAFLMWVRPPELRARREAERAQFLAGTSLPVSASVQAVPGKVATSPPTQAAPPAAVRPPAAPRPGWLDRLWIALTFRKAA